MSELKIFSKPQCRGEALWINPIKLHDVARYLFTPESTGLLIEIKDRDLILAVSFLPAAALERLFNSKRA